LNVFATSDLKSLSQLREQKFAGLDLFLNKLELKNATKNLSPKSIWQRIKSVWIAGVGIEIALTAAIVATA
jgi:hypothetical protein